MYQYNTKDQTLINQRTIQFKGQTERYLKGDIKEDEFRALRLMNGLYIQTHAPMLRVAIPYGLLAPKQLRMLAFIARKYDKSYAHITTRQNIQFNWPELKNVPAILSDLASVQMHAIQTSGNCIRNITCDHLAGVCVDEIEDPRPYCEIIRQWSTFHPEFAYLPRKFKIAVSGSKQDRAATQLHDIGVHVVKNSDREIGFKILIGGGLGRTPIIGKVIRHFLEKQHLLSYLEAILRVYNLNGRRDNKYKSRIKILVKESGIEQITELVEEEWRQIKVGMEISSTYIAEIQSHFKPINYDFDAKNDVSFASHKTHSPDFATWVKQNTHTHKISGYKIVFLALKDPNSPPGDITEKQLDAVADLADKYNLAEIRTTHRQNLVFVDVRQEDLFSLWQELKNLSLATPNIGTVTDMICCPGLDFCSLANAGSIGIAKEINKILNDANYLHDIGDIKINISGCMNGCAHQSVGHIGVLGVDKKGTEWYQLTIGGSSENQAALGERLGPAIAKDKIVTAIMAIIGVYIKRRKQNEIFLDTVKRIGTISFKEAVY